MTSWNNESHTKNALFVPLRLQACNKRKGSFFLLFPFLHVSYQPRNFIILRKRLTWKLMGKGVFHGHVAIPTSAAPFSNNSGGNNFCSILIKVIEVK
jgi:hypothetical protein